MQAKNELYELSRMIAGDIALAENSEDAVKKWRESFSISKHELAAKIEVSPSVLSDYESGRRKAGARMIRKFVGAIIEIDREKGGKVANAYEKMFGTGRKSTGREAKKDKEAIIDIGEFSSPLATSKFAESIGGKIAINRELSGRAVYGYTVIDSVNAILEFSTEELLNIYGSTSERALIFTKVTYGRSPLIAVRMTSIKPAAIVLHGIDKIDKLAAKIAQKEKIPVILTTLPIEKMLKELKKL